MEDAATAEISRTQIWQWIHNGVNLSDGRKITIYLYEQLKAEELNKIANYVGEEAFSNGRFAEAISLFDQLVKNDDFIDFLTLPAYELI